MRNNENSDAGTFFPQACTGYCGYFGGRKPPPTTVTPLQHVGAMVCSEHEAPYHGPVRQGGGKEAKAADRGVTAGETEEGLSGLW